MQLKDKIVVITGASSGIGAITARMLSEKGAVPVLLARSEKKLKETAAGIPGVLDCIPAMLLTRLRLPGCSLRFWRHTAELIFC